MNPIIIKMLLIVMPHMVHWNENQMSEFCENINPYVEYIAVNGLSEKDEQSLIKFLNTIIEYEESK